MMIASQCPKPNKNVVLVSRAYSELDLCEVLHKKPVVEFYNSQGRGFDTVNQMLRDNTCQPTCGSWVLAVLTFILDLAAVNARTILKYNQANYDTRRVFLRNLATSLMIPYTTKRAKVQNLKSVTVSTMNDVLAACGEDVLPDIENNEDQPDDKGGRYHVFLKNLRGMEDKERRRQKGNLNKIKKKCKNCKKAARLNHRSEKVEGGFLREKCSPL